MSCPKENVTTCCESHKGNGNGFLVIIILFAIIIGGALFY